MAEIYLEHEHNGSMVVYSDAEAVAWVARGWKKWDKQPGSAPIPEPKVESVKPDDPADDAPKKRRKVY